MKKLLLVLALCCTALAAQVIDGPYTHLRERVVTPDIIPIVAADVFTSTAWVEEIVLTNPSAAAVLVTIKDKQSTPREILKVSVPANGVVHSVFKGRYSPGGVNWVADSASVIGYIRARN